MGPGYELEKHESFPIFRMGVDYHIPVKDEWFVPVALIYDIKEGYSSWSVCLGGGIRF